MERGIILDHFKKRLKVWYSLNGRDMPWLKESDPYKIWLSEVILQQTRVAQGWKYYERFVAEFPDVYTLAASDEDNILRLWQGLGYYSRARNILKAARIIVGKYGGIFPREYDDILTLPGIGAYTASAISSFAYFSKIPVIDGNVYRVLSRILDTHFPIDDSQSYKYYYDLALEALDMEDPSAHNQAIMDFGALQCVPKNPDCNSCPMNIFCQAYLSDTVDILPIKLKKVKTRQRRINFIWVYNNKDETCLERRPAGDIWEGLYQPLMIEGEGELQVKEKVMEKYGIELIDMHEEYSVKHILTHQKLELQFYKGRWAGDRGKKINELKLCNTENLKNFAFPKPISDYIEKNIYL